MNFRQGIRRTPAIGPATIRMPKIEMGRIAAQMLIRHVESKEVVPPRKVYLSAELVVRRSTRALAASPKSARATVNRRDR